MLLSPGDLDATAHDRDHLLLHFARNGSSEPLLVLERGEGAYVFDRDGNAYLDGLSSLFCSQLGHSYGEEMAEAAATQLSTLAYANIWGAAHPAALDLAEALAERMPGDLDHVFFTGGGSESVESAWKLVRQFHVLNGEPQRTKVIARDIAYHGVSLAALAFSGVERIKAPFGAPAVETIHVANTNAFRAPEGDDEDALCRRLLAEIEGVIEREGADTIAMFIAEPVQNAGGAFTPPRGYWPGIRELCDRHGILLVSDEVIAGFGRFGEWLGIERYGVTPDLATTAKGLTSAYAPMGAVMVSEKVAAPFYAQGATLAHGLTFGGHPVCAAVARKNIEIFERDGIFEHVRATEPYLTARLNELRALPIVGDVRGAGFFWAVELVTQDGGRLDAEQREHLLRGWMPRRLLEAGLIARPDDRGDAVLHLAPPLISDHELIDTLVSRVGDVLTDAGRELQLHGRTDG